jgi:hypothetical protein
VDTAEAPEYYEAPPETASVHLASFEDGVRFTVCVFDHGGTFTHSETGATITVPDPLEVICEQ